MNRRRALKTKRYMDALTTQLVSEARESKRELDQLNRRIEELTHATDLAGSVWDDIRKRPGDTFTMLTAAGTIRDVLSQEMRRLRGLRDQHANVVESLRQRDIPAVNAALDDLIIGGIIFG